MKSLKSYIIFVVASLIACPTMLRAESVGLVLSGGGARGIAHVGVIKALEEHGVPIDYVAGTSMGAIVGSLYSCGYTPQQMLNLFTSQLFLNCSNGTIDKNQLYYFYRPEADGSIVSLDFDFRDSVRPSVVGMRANLVNPLPMNIEFLKIYAPYNEACNGDFDRLFVPFRCVYSDVYHKHKVVARCGSLANSVRASMSFPFVYQPIKMDGVLAYDGGIYDNFPVDVMKDDFAPDFIIGVSVSVPDTKPERDNIYSQLSDMIIQDNNYSLSEKEGIKIQVPVKQFGVLDFTKAQEIFDIGYKTGLAMVDSVKRRVASRISYADLQQRRDSFSRRVPPLIFDSVAINVNNDSGGYRHLLASDFCGDTLSIDRVGQAYYDVISTGRFAALMPTLERKDSCNILRLDARGKGRFSVGGGGWLTTSVNSMLYARVGFSSLGKQFVRLSLGGWFGQSYGAMRFSSEILFPSALPASLQLEGVLSRKLYYNKPLMFYDSGGKNVASQRESYLRLTAAVGLRRWGRALLGIGYAHDADRYQLTERYNTLKIRAGVESNTLDNEYYPTVGREMRFICDMRRISSNGIHTSFNLSALWRQYIRSGNNFAFGIYLDGKASFGPLWGSYHGALMRSSLFEPLPSMSCLLNLPYRADSYLAGGINPVWKPMDRLQFRGDLYLFMPFRDIKRGIADEAVYRGWCRRASVVAQLTGVINLSFAQVSTYLNYLSPGRWGVGVSAGIFFSPPRF